MSYNSLRKTAEYFEDRARRARHPDNHERLAAVAKKYRLGRRFSANLKKCSPTRTRARRSGDFSPLWPWARPAHAEFI